MTYIRCDVKTMCYIVFISHSLHWCYIKIAMQEYVMNPIRNSDKNRRCSL